MTTTLPPLDADRQRLVLNWVRLAKKHAWEACRRYRGAIDYELLLSDAYAGLVRAAAGFDPFRGLSFSTYADPAIRRSIWRGVNRHFRDRDQFRQFGVDEDSGASLDALVADHRQDAPDVPEEHRDLWHEAQRRLERCLKERERRIVELHVLSGQTFETVGRQVGLGAVRCCELCGVAIDRLRANRPVQVDDAELGPQACYLRRLAQETA